MKLTPNPVETGTPKYGGYATWGILAPPGGMDLHKRPSWAPMYVSPIYNKLVALNPEYFESVPTNVIGDLATDWEISEDGLVYTFNLAKGVNFHDGKPCTADDVVYSVEKFTNPETGSRIAPAFGAFDRIEKVDDYTVKIYLKSATPTFLLNLSDAYAVIQPKHLAGADDKSTDFLVGTGPYMFKEYQPQAHWEMVRNPNYFKKDKDGNQLPYLDGLKIFIMPQTATTDAFITKRINILNPAMALQMKADVDRIDKAVPDAETFYLTSGYGYHIWFNFKFEPLQDVRVRRAIALVMSSEDQIVAGFGDLTMGEANRYLFGKAWGLSYDEIKALLGWDKPYDERVKEAQALMKEAGYEDGFEVRMLFQAIAPGSASEGRYTVLADKLLTHLNIKGVLNGVPPAELYAQRGKGEYEFLSSVIYALTTDPDAFKGNFMTGSRTNFMGYSNPEIDKLWEAQAAEMDVMKRLEIAHEIERMLIKDMAVLPGAFLNGAMYYHKEVKNLRICANIYGPGIMFEEVWLAD